MALYGYDSFEMCGNYEGGKKSSSIGEKNWVTAKIWHVQFASWKKKNRRILAFSSLHPFMWGYGIVINNQ